MVSGVLHDVRLGLTAACLLANTFTQWIGLLPEHRPRANFACAPCTSIHTPRALFEPFKELTAWRPLSLDVSANDNGSYHYPASRANCRHCAKHLRAGSEGVIEEQDSVASLHISDVKLLRVEHAGPITIPRSQDRLVVVSQPLYPPHDGLHCNTSHRRDGRAVVPLSNAFGMVVQEDRG